MVQKEVIAQPLQVLKFFVGEYKIWVEVVVLKN